MAQQSSNPKIITYDFLTGRVSERLMTDEEVISVPEDIEKSDVEINTAEEWQPDGN